MHRSVSSLSIQIAVNIIVLTMLVVGGAFLYTAISYNRPMRDIAWSSFFVVVLLFVQYLAATDTYRDYRRSKGNPSVF